MYKVSDRTCPEFIVSFFALGNKQRTYLNEERAGISWNYLERAGNTWNELEQPVTRWSQHRTDTQHKKFIGGCYVQIIYRQNKFTNSYCHKKLQLRY